MNTHAAENPSLQPTDARSMNLRPSTQVQPEPFAPKGFVALASRTSVRELRPPQQSEEPSSVGGPDEMPKWNQRNRQIYIPLIGPLLQHVEPRRGVPPELAVV